MCDEQIDGRKKQTEISGARKDEKMEDEEMSDKKTIGRKFVDEIMSYDKLTDENLSGYRDSANDEI